MPPVNSILFDFDGVLLDSEPIHFSCWQEALAPLGVRIDWETHGRNVVGFSERATVEFFAASQGRDVEELWARYPVKQQLFRERMAAGAPFAPGLADFLEELGRRYKLAVVTSSGRSEIEPVLERSGLRRFFGVVVCGDDVEHPKPAPDPYLLAARLLGVDTALVVEDSDAGMESARRAGFEALRVGSAAETIPLVRARAL
ncbi:MAG: HAD family hydrolase [Bryobacteraceae bacterium]